MNLHEYLKNIKYLDFLFIEKLLFSIKTIL